MKTNDLKDLSPLEKVTLPTAAMPGRMDSQRTKLPDKTACPFEKATKLPVPSKRGLP
jgi:hypothetical protein